MSLVTRLRRSAAVENSPADPADHPTDELQPVETTDEAQPTTEGRPADDSAADSAADDAGDASDASDASDAEGGEAGVGSRKRRGRVRVVLGAVVTVLAVAFVLFGLVVPDDYGDLHAASFVRLPLEALVAVAVLVVLPRRPRWILATVLGVVLGLLTILKVVDLGFTAILARHFNLVLDWILLGDATGVVQDSIGTLGAVLTVVGACLLVIAILVLMTLAVLRLTRLVAAHHTATLRTVSVLAVAWIALATFGVQLADGGAVASRADASLVVNRYHSVSSSLHDQADFEAQAKVDPFQNTPGNQLLNGLRGKDVLLTFVESYGRYAVEDPKFAPPVDAQLDAATRRLDALGFGSRSAYLSSSTVGGASWLAHSSLLSGLYIDSQQRYRSLVASNRLTLTSAFKKAGWKTVSVEPAITGAWPEGKFFGYEQDYDARNLGYKGSRFSYATMPDQYLYSVFHRNELKPGHSPVFAEITTVSSHSPWTPIPKMVGWDQVGDGSLFDNPANQEGGPPGSILGSADKLRASYIRSIQYSLDALVSYVENYGDKNLVLVFLGDHQPAPIVTGQGASRDVPITIVAKDPKVLDRISSWNWTPGLRPAPNAPETRMDTFRNQFMTTFGPADPAH
ncbi:MAG TPA: sulfatase-like hydrolase/transferase [Mycobacteriales bacterium]|nr:sulfatase-like hydrolase/transferase [Mycobacteriales bacterium]